MLPFLGPVPRLTLDVMAIRLLRAVGISKRPANLFLMLPDSPQIITVFFPSLVQKCSVFSWWFIDIMLISFLSLVIQLAFLVVNWFYFND